jgi:hypothetical protein
MPEAAHMNSRFQYSNSVQTLGLERETRRNPKAREIGLPWSLLAIPVLFIAAGLSLPYSLFARRVQQRRERAFRAQMQAQGRVIEWSDFLKAINETRGTLIEERYSFKGPVRWWWTPENVYDICSHSPVNWLAMVNDRQFRPFVEWCHQRYTSPDKGQALLVTGALREQAHSLWSRLESESGTERWVEVPPPEEIRRRRRV